MNAFAETPDDRLSPIGTDESLSRLAGGVDAPCWTDSGARLQMVPVEALLIDRSYQRKVSSGGGAKIRKMMRAFSWARFGALIVARDDAGFAVIDGQHRAIMAAHLGFAEVPAIVVSVDRAEQARDFLEVNIARTSLPSVDKFRASVAAGDEKAVALHETLRDLGINFDLRPGQRMGPRDTRAVARLQNMVAGYGQGTVYTALEMMIEAQPDTEELLTSFACRVVVDVLDRILTAEADIDRLADTLRFVDFEQMEEDARHLQKVVGGKQARHGVTLLARAYNKGLRTGRIDE